MQFSFPPELVYPVLVSFAFPITLALVSHVSRLRARNAMQFLVASLVHVTLWLAIMSVAPVRYRPDDASSWLIGAMVIASFLLLYLEAWALLSRGYTLAMLLALLDSDRPLSADAIAARYRNGDGLEWILRHRLSGLEGAGMIKRRGRTLALSPRLGVSVVLLYRIVVVLFGLKRTG